MTMATTDSKLDIINSAACRKKKSKTKNNKTLGFQSRNFRRFFCDAMKCNCLLPMKTTAWIQGLVGRNGNIQGRACSKQRYDRITIINFSFFCL